MHASIEIDDDLMDAARRATGLENERAVVEEALRIVVRLKAQERMKELRGKVAWEGDLDELRRSRFTED